LLAFCCVLGTVAVWAFWRYHHKTRIHVVHGALSAYINQRDPPQNGNESIERDTLVLQRARDTLVLQRAHGEEDT
jgi:hypothetical protein